MFNIKRLLFRQWDSEKKDMLHKITQQAEEIKKLKGANSELEQKAFMLSLDDESIHKLSHEFKSLYQFGNLFVIEVDGFKAPYIYDKNEDLVLHNNKRIGRFLYFYMRLKNLKTKNDAMVDILNNMGRVIGASDSIDRYGEFPKYDYRIYNGFALYRVIYLDSNDFLVFDYNKKNSIFLDLKKFRPMIFGLDILYSNSGCPVFLFESEYEACRFNSSGQLGVGISWLGGKDSFSNVNWSALEGRDVYLVRDGSDEKIINDSLTSLDRIASTVFIMENDKYRLYLESREVVVFNSGDFLNIFSDIIRFHKVDPYLLEIVKSLKGYGCRGFSASDIKAIFRTKGDVCDQAISEMLSLNLLFRIEIKTQGRPKMRYFLHGSVWLPKFQDRECA